jgi:hypothetical protein
MDVKTAPWPDCPGTAVNCVTSHLMVMASVTSVVIAGVTCGNRTSARTPHRANG